MEKCFRCGADLKSPKCSCGYDIKKGIRLLTPWKGDLSYLRQQTEQERRAQEREQEERWKAAREQNLNRIRNVILIVAALILVAGVIALIAEPAGSLWQILFSCALAISVGATSVLYLIKVGDERKKIDLLVALVLILSLLNLILLFVLPGWYDMIGCTCAVTLIALYLYLLIDEIRQWGIDAFDTRSGGIVYIFCIFVNLLLAGHGFGLSISWILFFILLVVFGIFVAISEFGDVTDEHVIRNCLVSGVMVVLSVAYICCCLFAPHFVHGLRELPEPGNHDTISDSTAHADCACGEEIQINEFLGDCLHTYMHFDWFVGNTYNMDYLMDGHLEYCEDFHWVVCTCGARFNLGNHMYDNGVCLCGHREGEPVASLKE